MVDVQLPQISSTFSKSDVVRQTWYRHAWGSRTYYGQLRLDPLPAERTAELLEALLGDQQGLELLKQMLIRRGNPFFLEETVRTLVETKALVGERGRYRLTQPMDSIRVPDTVQAVWP